MIRKGMLIGDRYEVVDKVGSGGMSNVYRAKDHKLGRFVAIKVLKQEFCEDKSFVSRFKIEAQSAAGLAHPNIVNIFDVGEDNGIYYIVMELIDGITLKKYIERKGKLPYKEAVSIAIQIAQGMEAAHNNHIIHRDIKPQNVLISREGKVKVTDFGIARAASSDSLGANAMGSVHYISPEQAKNGFVDEKSDIYSLGISLFEMITGTVPYEGESTVAIALQHVQEQMPSMRTYAVVPISIEKIVEKCTQKDPERRYSKAASLISDLKKSLVTPDEDFVVLNNEEKSALVITQDDINGIRNEAGISDYVNPGYDTASIRNTTNIDLKAEPLVKENTEDEDDDFKLTQGKYDKVITIASIAGTVLVLIIILVLVLAFKGNCSGTSGNESTTTNSSSKLTTVPDVVGYDIDAAEEALEEAHLEYKITYEESNDIEENIVMEQSIEAGESVARSSTVTLVVSAGKEAVTVPDVVGLSEEEASEQLEAEGFVVKITRENSDTVEVGIVISTDPDGGDSVPYGTTIEVVSSYGADSVVTVPDVVGLTEEEAEALLNENMLSMKVNYIYDDDVEEGVVISQDVEAGEKLDVSAENVNTTVVVNVSKGKDYSKTITTPSISYSNVPTLDSTQKLEAYVVSEVTYVDPDGVKQTDTSNAILNASGKSTITYTAAMALEGTRLTYTADISDTSTDVTIKIILYYREVETTEEDTTTEEETTTTSSADLNTSGSMSLSTTYSSEWTAVTIYSYVVVAN